MTKETNYETSYQNQTEVSEALYALVREGHLMPLEAVKEFCSQIGCSVAYAISLRLPDYFRKAYNTRESK